MSQNKLVYIVDDDPMQVQMMSDHLKDKYKFDVRGFPTGEEAVNNLTNKPDIIVLDYYLNTVSEGARNGADILRFIKKEFPEIKVIMVSGQDSMAVAVDTMRYGANDYVVKGENQFIRLEHAVDKIFDSERLAERVRYYKNLNNILIGALALIIILTITLSVMDVI
jgi:two-component system OmpR family response regulator